MSMTFGSQGRSTSEINVTPMIDVLLVLLIIFMISYHSVGVTADIPHPSTDQPITPPTKPIVIQIKQGVGSGRPTLKINDEEVSWDNLGSRIGEIFSVRTEKVAFLKGDPEVTFQYVADALDIVHHAGVARVGLMDN